MRIRNEIAFFLVFAAFLGWRTWSVLGAGETAVRGTRSRRASELDYVPERVPDAGLAVAVPRAAALERDLFSPPSATSPLPLLDLEPAPMEPLEVLGPPTAWGPAPRAMGAVQRRPPEVTDVPGLFDLAEEQDVDVGGGTVDPGSLTALEPDELDAEARLERIEALKRQYDWIQIVDLKFGYIKNADRFLLPRNQEPILFVEVDPAIGAPRFPAAIEYGRDRFSEFAFADTPPNRIELRRLDFGDVLRPAEFDAALEFAEECVRLRNEAPRALEIAEEMFLRAAQVGTDTVRARLGLARCYELAFRFEDALLIYRELVAGEGATRPEPWARLGDLYARFRLHEKAEAAYDTAVGRGRTFWESRWRRGRHLARRERWEEARADLAAALQREPIEPGLRAARVAIRADLAGVLVALGQLEEARELFQRALQADPQSDLGLAGWISIAALTGEETPADDGAAGPDASFDLLLARGLVATYQGSWAAARRTLEQALEADPFRAALVWRTVSWLAERTGHPEEALVAIERAFEADPTDPWTLAHRGRLYAEQDDPATARASLLAALDRELDFPDVLVQLGQLTQELGEHAAAERYYERALLLEPGRAVVHSMRGANLLQVGDLEGAGDAFRAALALDEGLASARNGLAWWHYVRGDSTEAVTLFAQLADRRRNAPANDPHRAYAEAQKERILDHESKEVWTDRFDRVGLIKNDWSYDQGLGADVRLADGAVRIQGQLTKDGSTRLLRELPADRFLAYESTVTIEPSSSAVTVGVFVSKETGTRAGDVRTNAAVSLTRNGVDGAVQARLIKRGESEPEVTDLSSTTWPLGQPVRIRLERHGESATDTTITLWLDDVPVLERLPVQALGRSNQALRFGVFVEGKSGRTVDVAVDDVRVVRRVL